MVYNALNAMTVVFPEPGPEQQETRFCHCTSRNNCEQLGVGLLQVNLPLHSVWQMTAGA